MSPLVAFRFSAVLVVLTAGAFAAGEPLRPDGTDQSPQPSQTQEPELQKPESAEVHCPMPVLGVGEERLGSMPSVKPRFAPNYAYEVRPPSCSNPLQAARRGNEGRPRPENQPVPQEESPSADEAPADTDTEEP